MVRARSEDYVARTLAILDAADGDTDMEPDDDCCAVADDDLSSRPDRQHAGPVMGPGTPEDAEDDAAGVSCQPVTLAPDWVPTGRVSVPRLRLMTESRS